LDPLYDVTPAISQKSCDTNSAFAYDVNLAGNTKLLFLPPYSPDLSPIEPAWSKVKALLRRSAARSYDALLDAVVSALGAITRDDARGWFRLCGYGPCV
jgi:transposase